MRGLGMSELWAKRRSQSSIPSRFRKYWLHGAIILAVTFTLFALVFLAQHPAVRLGQTLWNPPVYNKTPGKDMSRLLPEMWADRIHNLSDSTFVAEDGTKYEIKPESHRWEKMGKKILIIDVDSRLDASKGAMLNQYEPRQASMKGRTAGIMNHLLYALVHGYDYRLIRSPSYTDRHGTWVKIPIMRRALQTHDMVIFLDSDAIFENINLPFEWLLSHWDVQPSSTLLTIARDPGGEHNSDARGKVMWNTGFMVGQRNSLTEEMFERWENCPTGQRYEECRKWAYDWAHEQAAFANHVRYEYEEGQDVRVLECNEGNGMPGPRGGSNCNGVFIRHYWFDKDTTVTELYQNMDKEGVVDLHRHFHDRLGDYFLDASSAGFPLADDLVI